MKTEKKTFLPYSTKVKKIVNKFDDGELSTSKSTGYQSYHRKNLSFLYILATSSIYKHIVLDIDKKYIDTGFKSTTICCFIC